MAGANGMTRHGNTRTTTTFTSKHFHSGLRDKIRLRAPRPMEKRSPG